MTPEQMEALADLHSALSLVFLRVHGLWVDDWQTYLTAVVKLNRFLGHDPEDFQQEDSDVSPKAQQRLFP